MGASLRTLGAKSWAVDWSCDDLAVGLADADVFEQTRMMKQTNGLAFQRLCGSPFYSCSRVGRLAQTFPSSGINEYVYGFMLRTAEEGKLRLPLRYLLIVFSTAE